MKERLDLFEGSPFDGLEGELLGKSHRVRGNIRAVIKAFYKRIAETWNPYTLLKTFPDFRPASLEPDGLHKSWQLSITEIVIGKLRERRP